MGNHPHQLWYAAYVAGKTLLNVVEAHGGVIWAENIRPTDADIGSEPLGARFVVGLPV